MGNYQYLTLGTLIITGIIILIILAMILQLVYTTKKQGNDYGFYTSFASAIALVVATIFIVMECMNDKEYMCKFVILIALVVLLAIVIVIWRADEPFKQPVTGSDIGTLGQVILTDATDVKILGTQQVTKLAFDNKQPLKIGEKKGFTISMFIGARYPNTALMSATNTRFRVPLFIRGDIQKARVDFNESEYNTYVVTKSIANANECPYSGYHRNGDEIILRKCPLIWLIVEMPQSNSTIKDNELKMYFQVEFNQSRPETDSALIDDITNRNCKSVDPITAKCTILKNNVKFAAISKFFDINRNNNMMSNVTFVFEEVTVPTFEGSAMYKDMTNITLYINGKALETSSYEGRVHITGNLAQALPDVLPPSEKTTLSSQAFDCQLANVQYFNKPLSSSEIESFVSSSKISFGYIRSSLSNMDASDVDNIDVTMVNPLKRDGCVVPLATTYNL